SWSGRRRQKSSLPTNWPLVGMLPELLLNIHRIYDYFTEILEESGGTLEIKGPWFAHMDMLGTCDPDNIHNRLSKKFSNFRKGPDFIKIFDALGDGIFNSEGESWKTQRKTALPPSRLPQRFTYDTACKLVLGHDPTVLSIDLPEYPHQTLFGDGGEAVFYRHFLPESCWKLQSWLRMGAEKKLSNALKTLHQFLDNCISSKREELRNRSITKMEDKDQGEFSDLLTLFMIIAEEIIGVTLSGDSEKFLRDILLNFLFAGRDSLSAVLSWFFWLVGTYPIVEKEIREEIIQNLPVKEDGSWSFSCPEDVKKLVYLRAAICETLRLYPPVGLNHKAPLQNDFLPSGHCMNQNTKTVLSFYSMGRMETIWGKDCLEFKPRRWISEKGGIKHEPSFKFPAFNAGPRTCLGKEISFIQMQIVAATIIHNYHIQVVEGHHRDLPRLLLFFKRNMV
ncbi:unnamed protein product, partial [Ilex paraguariensis]